MSIFNEPNISCLFCNNRHPSRLSCREAAKEAAKAAAELERQPAPRLPPIVQEVFRPAGIHDEIVGICAQNGYVYVATKYRVYRLFEDFYTSQLSHS